MDYEPISKADALEALKPKKPWKPGIYDGVITIAIEGISLAGKPMQVLSVTVRDREGEEREFRDYLTHHTPKGAAKFRNACIAINALEKYEAREITSSDFQGEVRVTLNIERKTGWPPRNIITDYHPTTNVVVLHREAG